MKSFKMGKSVQKELKISEKSCEKNLGEKVGGMIWSQFRWTIKKKTLVENWANNCVKK